MSLLAARRFSFPSGEHDVREVGTKLGVRYVVQGAAQISGNKIRVSVGLASTETSQEVGTWQYNKKLGDVLVIQDEIASQLVAAIESEVQKQEMLRSTLMPSSNRDAWSAYHRALNHMYRFRTKDCDSAEVFSGAPSISSRMCRAPMPGCLSSIMSARTRISAKTGSIHFAARSTTRTRLSGSTRRIR